MEAVCVADVSVELSAYIFGARKQGEQGLKLKAQVTRRGRRGFVGIVKNTPLFRVDSSSKTSVADCHTVIK
jgi:hypothetical protein